MQLVHPTVEKFIFQQARKEGKDPSELVSDMEKMILLCGDYSRGQKQLRAIARTMLKNDCVNIVAPCCPDYSYEDGRYTFKNLGDGVSLLAEEHIHFLERITAVIPSVKVTFLVADQESSDLLLQKTCNVTAEEFMLRVQRSLEALQKRILGRSWNAVLFSEYIPNLEDREDVITSSLMRDSKYCTRLKSETLSRAPMYRKISHGMTSEEMFRRTARTAAQYLVLGEVASEKGVLVSNHTTTNLSWYTIAGVGVLHNSVEIY